MKHFAFALLACLALAGPTVAADPPDEVRITAQARPEAPPPDLMATNTLGGIAPLTVVLASGHACPAPAQPRDLLRMPEGCPTPWAGILYTPQADAETRAELAAADRVCGKLDDELTRCRSARTRLADDVLAQLPDIGAKLDTVATLLRSPQPAAPLPDPQPAVARHKPVPWASAGGGGAIGGAGLAYLLNAGPGRQLISTAGGAVLGVGIAAIVQAFDG